MKALVICAYMGPLPSLMPLWIRTAAHNPQVDFLIVSDQAEPEGLPANVRFQHATLAALAEHWSALLGFEVALTSPYKLNDFKSLFWSLVPELDRYDYWGYCDLDVLFGDLAPLLDQRLGRYDMILSEGHLRFLRNDDRTRQAFRAVRQPRGWRDILTDPVNFGMDEHWGINQVFRAPDRGWFANSALIADIHPSFRQMRRLPHLPNHRIQAFYWQDGRIYREFIAADERRTEEYLYIHLQKRTVPIDPASADAAAFNIDPGGIAPRRPGDEAERSMRRRNPWHWPNSAEARILIRQLRSRMFGGTDVFEPKDRPSPESGA